MNALQHDVQTLDLIDLVHRMVDAALAVSTGQLGLAEPAETHGLLLEGNLRATRHFQHELARQIGAALMWLEPQVSAVFDGQDTPVCADEAAEDAAAGKVRIIIQVASETATLRSVLDALNDAFNQAAFDILGVPDGALIDAIVVDKEAGRLLRMQAFGFQSAPLLLASGENSFTGGTPG